MKVNKEFKREFDDDFAESSYASRRLIWKCVSWIIALNIIFGCFGIGWKYLHANASREIFKQSVTYNEGMLDDLAKYKFEYDTATDDTERQAIASLVRNRFHNFDKSKIENNNLVNFLRECGV